MHLSLALSDFFFFFNMMMCIVLRQKWITKQMIFHLQRALGKNGAAEYQNMTEQMEGSILEWSPAEGSLLCCEIFCWGLLWADVSRQFHEFVMPVITSCGVESKSWCLHGFWLCKTNSCLWYTPWTYSKKPKLLENYHNQLILVILRAIAPSQVSPILSAALEWSILKQCIEQNTVFAEIKEN